MAPFVAAALPALSSVGKQILFGIILQQLFKRGGSALASQGAKTFLARNIGKIAPKGVARTMSTGLGMLGTSASVLGNAAGRTVPFLLSGAGSLLGAAGQGGGALLSAAGQGAGALLGAAGRIPGALDPTSEMSRARWGGTPLSMVGDITGTLGQGLGGAVSAIGQGLGTGVSALGNAAGNTLSHVAQTAQLAQMREDLMRRNREVLDTIEKQNYSASTKRLAEQLARTEGQLALPTVRRGL
jgi:hypothetical protein